MERVLDVAVLSPTPSHPHDFGNRKRIHAVCTALAERGARIRFLLYPLEDEWRYVMPRDACESMRRAWYDFQIIPPSVSCQAPAKGADHTIDEWWDPVLESFLKWYFERTPVDAFIVNYAYLSRALQLAPQNCLKVLDTHDRVSGRRERLAELGIEQEWFHTTAEEEAIGIARADLVLAIKAEEKPFFEGLGSAPVMTLPFIEKRVALTKEPGDQREYLRIGMLGARNSINVKSVTRFLDRALPRFRDFMAPVKIILAGTMCANLEGAAHNKDIEILGALRDVGDFYNTVDVVVGPVEQSTGQKIRIGEALAFGVPIISLAHTFEGYPPTHAWHQLSDIDSVVDACIDLAFDRSGLAALRKASEISYDRQDALIEKAVDFLVEKAATFAATDLFIVDVARLAANPLLVRHIAAMVLAAAAVSKVLILLDGNPNDACCVLIRLTQSFARVWTTGEIPSGFEFPDIETPISRDALFARFRIGNVWLYGSADHLERMECGATLVVAPGMTDVVLRGAGLEGYSYSAEGLLCLGRAEGRGARSAVRVDKVMSVPYFSPHIPENVADGPLFVGRPVVAIIVSPSSADFALSVAAIVARHVRWQRPILLIAADRATVSRVEAAIASAPHAYRDVSVAACPSDALYEHAIDLVVDMGGSASAFALLVEYAASRGVPVLRAQDGTALPADVTRGEPGRISFLMRVLRAVSDAEFRQTLRKNWSEHRDDQNCLELLGDVLIENSKWTIDGNPALRPRSPL